MIDVSHFEFGMAGGKQRAAEAALERIIVVLSRRREPDKQLLKELANIRRELQRALTNRRS